MLWTIIAVLVVLWLVGMFAQVGSLIHLLLVAAIVVFVIKMLTSSRTV